MDVQQLADGLWRWSVAGAVCVYYEAAHATVLIDPIVPPGEQDEFFRHLDADVERRGLPMMIVVTGPDRRSADELAARYGGRILDSTSR